MRACTSASISAHCSWFNGTMLALHRVYSANTTASGRHVAIVCSTSHWQIEMCFINGVSCIGATALLAQRFYVCCEREKHVWSVIQCVAIVSSVPKVCAFVAYTCCHCHVLTSCVWLGCSCDLKKDSAGHDLRCPYFYWEEDQNCSKCHENGHTRYMYPKAIFSYICMLRISICQCEVEHTIATCLPESNIRPEVPACVLSVLACFVEFCWFVAEAVCLPPVWWLWHVGWVLARPSFHTLRILSGFASAGCDTQRCSCCRISSS